MANLPPGLDPKKAKLPAEQSYEAQMAAAHRAGNTDELLAVLRRAQSEPGALNVRMLNMEFSARVDAGESVEKAAVEMLKSCATHKLAPSTALMNNVLGRLSKHAPPESVLAWVARMRDAGTDLDTWSCNIQLKAHLSMRDFTAAISLLSAMVRGVEELPPPDAISFNTVLDVLCAAGEAERAEEVLAAMISSGASAKGSAPISAISADVHSYTAVISAFVKRGPLEPRAEKWLRRMLDANIVPDTLAFNTVLAGYATHGDADGAARALDAFARASSGFPASSRPDVVSYNTLIAVCARSGRTKEAEAAFEGLVNARLSPNQLSYSSVISAHARAGDAAAAQRWLANMRNAGIAPDAVTYNTVCSAHARDGDAASALAAFVEMERLGVSPTPATYSIMVNTLVQAGELERAESALKALVDAKEPLTASSFNPLISAHAKAAAPARAEAIVSLMSGARVPPTLVTFNALASAHAAVGDLDATERVALGLALGKHRMRLDRYTHGALLQAAARAKPSYPLRAEKARAHVGRLLSSGIELNPFLEGACRRAVGDAEFAQMRAEARAAARPARAARPAVSAAAAAPPSPEANKNGRSSSPETETTAEEEEGEEGAWTTAARRRRRGGGTRRGPAAPIKKAPMPPPPASDGAVRFAGVPLTRSRSSRLRMLALAQGVVGAASGGLPAGAAGGAAGGAVGGLPLTRSAASELAITLSTDMSL